MYWEMMAEDMDLVREYARHRSEHAFAELVSRHINLVYSVAFRYVQNAHLAEEITQAVFVLLAQKGTGVIP
jgi:DNA-directed RNA polymerase specialized sigma24 family protein